VYIFSFVITCHRSQILILSSKFLCVCVCMCVCGGGRLFWQLFCVYIWCCYSSWTTSIEYVWTGVHFCSSTFIHGCTVVTVCSPDGWALYVFDSDTVTSVIKSSHWLNSTREFEILQSQLIEVDPCIHKFFQKSRSHIQILDAWTVVWSKFNTEDPKFWSDLWCSLLNGTLCFMHMNWCIFLCVKTKEL
jgi:hypothetical protein